MNLKLLPLPFLALATAAAAQPAGSTAEPFRYQMPPAPIDRMLAATSTPFVLLNPTRDRLALLTRPAMPPISALAEPELVLAGQNINPRTNGPSRTPGYEGLAFRGLAGQEQAIALPPGTRLIAPIWSPDGRRLAFLLLREDGVELWIAEVATGVARRLVEQVNAALPRAFEWRGDSAALLVRRVPASRGAPPDSPRIPAGPIVDEGSGRAAPAPSLRNRLAGPHQEDLFEHYLTAELALVSLNGMAPWPVGATGLIAGASLSPDGNHVLQHRLKRPFGSAGSVANFPTEILVTDLNGRTLRRIADLPGDEPAGSVATGPRAVHWRDDAPATLVWVEAQDGGDESREVAVRDRLLMLEAPFAGPPRRLVDLPHRFMDVIWGRSDFALVLSTSRSAAREYRTAIDPSRPGTGRLLQMRRYRGGTDAGTPLVRADDRGRERLQFTPDGRALLLDTRTGLARLDLAGGAPVMLWNEAPGEELVAPLDDAAERMLVRRQSPTSPPDLFLVDRRSETAQAVTAFRDPMPEFARIQQRRLAFSRDDGVALSGTLFLPAGYDASRDGPVPVLIWAYPSSVRDVPAPAEPVTAPFVRPHGFDDLPLLLATQGYAIFRPSFPIVGRNGTEPNDTHVEQLVANARAAIDVLVAEGIADRGRVAIGGHSYGAAMAANLLAHSDLFRTGIALSGAYNRTLTPFGFQAVERRNFWEARDAYLAMSPLVHADRIDEPLLLVHGEADLNAGTEPMQSERLYAAIRGLGGTARYVLLPHEGHAYQARESVSHLMWELTQWLERHLGQLTEETAVTQ